ncbi:hypothetical protein ACFSJ3_06040 [Corallincola platygyrae]|uniref:Uncharacterized protein n=1 Tax=Corallincola platygyrae TaxID=1193278 RepID=A0ABW4XJ25_9GAMM
MLTLVLVAVFIAILHGYNQLKKVDTQFSDRLIRSMVLCILAGGVALFSDMMNPVNITAKSMQSAARMVACGIAMAAVSRALHAVLLFANHRRETGTYRITSSSESSKEDELAVYTAAN